MSSILYFIKKKLRSYIKLNRVLDLGTLSNTTIVDLSGQSNDASVDITDDTWTVLDSPSLDGLRTVFGVAYNGGYDNDLIDFSNGAGTTKVNFTSNTLTSTGLTSPTYYVNGVATTTVPSGWFTYAVTFSSYIPTADIEGYMIHGKHILYTQELSAPEISYAHTILNSPTYRYTSFSYNGEPILYNGELITYNSAG